MKIVNIIKNIFTKPQKTPIEQVLAGGKIVVYAGQDPKLSVTVGHTGEKLFTQGDIRERILLHKHVYHSMGYPIPKFRITSDEFNELIYGPFAEVIASGPNLHWQSFDVPLVLVVVNQELFMPDGFRLKVENINETENNGK